MILQPIMSEHVTSTEYSATIPGSRCDQVMLSCDVSTCIDHVNYPTITCDLITSNDNDFKNKRKQSVRDKHPSQGWAYMAEGHLH